MERIAAPVPRVSKRMVEAFLGAHESVTAAVATKEVLSAEDRARFDALQAAIGLAKREIPDEPAGEMWAPENAVLSQVQSFLAEQALAGAMPPPEEVMYDDHDLGGWAQSFFSWWRRIIKHRFVDATAASVIPIPNQARLALFGDWGSGRYGAPVLAGTIGRMPGRLDAVIHLGDTYYSGTENEVASHLLAVWPRRTDARGFTLNGNHEMYGGGIGYFQALAQLGQPSSYFALRNDDWLIVALDTAYDNHSLHGNQADWLTGLAQTAGPRRIVLLSHHQPFSAFEKSGPALVQALGTLLNGGRIHAWYWGHEHRLALYEPHPAWGLLGRCVGHGGYPYFKVANPGAWDALTGDSGSQWLRIPAGARSPGGIVLSDDNPYVLDDPTRPLDRSSFLAGFSQNGGKVDVTF